MEDPRVVNPRSSVLELISRNDMKELLIQAAQIHGHYCPGLAMGVMASFAAVTHLGTDPITAVASNRSCWLDGIQFVAGCTEANHSLTVNDRGVSAVTFTKKGSDSSLKVTVTDEYMNRVNKIVPGFAELRSKMGTPESRTPEFQKEFRAKAVAGAFGIINEPVDELFKFELL